MTQTTPKRKGQHDVHAILRVYSAEGGEAVQRLTLGPAAGSTTVRRLSTDEPFDLWYVHWRPRPTKNEWNTEHDFRQKLIAVFDGRWCDIVMAKYDWKPVM